MSRSLVRFWSGLSDELNGDVDGWPLQRSLTGLSLSPMAFKRRYTFPFYISIIPLFCLKPHCLRPVFFHPLSSLHVSILPHLLFSLFLSFINPMWLFWSSIFFLFSLYSTPAAVGWLCFLRFLWDGNPSSPLFFFGAGLSREIWALIIYNPSALLSPFLLF